MIVTKHFVMLNFPKTGSSFARAVLKQIINKRAERDNSEFVYDFTLPNLKIKGRERDQDQHGMFSQIPREFKKLPVISIVRNPFERLVSTYEFRHWAKWHSTPLGVIKDKFNEFPKLSFEDYIHFTDLELIHGRMQRKNLDSIIGNQTALFIQMFFKNPDSVLDSISDVYLESNQWIDDIGQIKFFRQENFRDDLNIFLRDLDFTEVERDLIFDTQDINVTPNRLVNRNSYWTQESIDYVLSKEKLIFKVLAAQYIFYEKPIVNQ